MKYTIFRSKKNRKWYWNLRAKNHRIVATSEGYNRKAGALNAIRAIRMGAATGRLVING
jgi:uncharacterized protein YegP (UPF0339 family)